MAGKTDSFGFENYRRNDCSAVVKRCEVLCEKKN